MDGTCEFSGDGDDEGGCDDGNVQLTLSLTSEGENDDLATEREEGSSSYVSASAAPEDPFRVDEMDEVRFATSPS